MLLKALFCLYLGFYPIFNKIKLTVKKGFSINFSCVKHIFFTTQYLKRIYKYSKSRSCQYFKNLSSILKTGAIEYNFKSSVNFCIWWKIQFHSSFLPAHDYGAVSITYQIELLSDFCTPLACENALFWKRQMLGNLARLHSLFLYNQQWTRVLIGI